MKRAGAFYCKDAYRAHGRADLGEIFGGKAGCDGDVLNSGNPFVHIDLTGMVYYNVIRRWG